MYDICRISPRFVGCCVVSIAGHVFIFNKYKKIAKKKILKSMGPMIDPCGTSNKISSHEL